MEIDHRSESTYSSFEKLIKRNFYRLTKFSLFDQVASFNHDFLAKPKVTKKILSRGNSIFLIGIEKSIGLIAYFFER